LNGYLLSREYFELVAVRHFGPKEIKAIRLENRRTLFFTGVIIAFLLSIPILNLLAPIVATAAMVHVLKHLEQ
jgi:CysZ protein